MMYDFDPDEAFRTEKGEVFEECPGVKELHCIVLKDNCGFISHTFVWMTLGSEIVIDQEELRYLNAVGTA